MTSRLFNSLNLNAEIACKWKVRIANYYCLEQCTVEFQNTIQRKKSKINNFGRERF